MNLIKIRILLTALIVVIILSACEEVIEIDLNSSEPVISAEGVMEKDSVAWLRLCYTTDYFKAEESEKIENAIVTINDSEGNFENLTHLGGGFYKGNTILGETNMEYTLTFSIEDYSTSASTVLYDPVEIYSLEFMPNEMPRPGEEDSYTVTLKFSNTSAANEFNMVKFWTNGVEENALYYLVNDEYYAKGDTIEYSPFQLSFEEDDELKIFVYSIDEDTYKYYSQLNDLNGGRMGASSTPYNPQSNFGDEVMGYFPAWSFAEFLTTVE
jgi:hypothetical protein